MKKTCLKDGKEVIIRKAKKEDAQSMIEFYNIVGGETDFLSFGKNEFKKDLKEYENYIEVTSGENTSIILLATINDKIIGIASIDSGKKARRKHVGEFGIVITQKYCGLGLGRKFMDDLIQWAKSNGITKKITLAANENNNIGIGLYKKVGFEQEGLLKGDNFIDGVYCNTIVMGLIL